MGLLDALQSDQGLFGLSLLAAAAPRAGGRTSIGEGLLGASQAVAQRRQQAQEQAMRQQMQQAQLAEFQAKAQERQAAMTQAQQQAQRQQMVGELLGREDVTPQQLFAAGVPPEIIKARFEAKNYGRSKVARTIDGKDAQGRPITLQLDEFGQPMGEAVPQWKAPIQADTGGAVNFIDPTTLDPLAVLKKSNTPDALLSAQTSMRGQNMVDARSREAAAASRAEGGKPPTGYRWKADGSGLEAIPGGPADIKAGELGAKAEKAKAATISGANSVLETVREARGLVSPASAGLGSWAAVIPATDARNLQAKLDTIKGNLGFDRLQQMRDMSPTGGALGSVAVQELTALQSTISSLDAGQSPAQLKRSLDKVERHYQNWLKTVEGDKPAGGSNIDDLVNKYRSK